MDKRDELIAKQALKIEELEIELAAYQEAESRIHNIIYRIGGPLNDNKLGYSKAQLLPFFQISELLSVD